MGINPTTNLRINGSRDIFMAAFIFLGMQTISFTSIATIYNSRKEPTDDNWGHVVSEIKLNDGVSADGYRGIENFNFLEVIFFFHLLPEDRTIKWSRKPRGNEDFPEMGCFAQRHKNRPNQIGACTCKFVKKEGKSIWVKGLDAINETPVLDIKPIFKEYTPTQTEIEQPEWVSELMKNYW